ncbi:TPA: hypothetical protein ACVU31_002471 [Vibrio parahaemolyticus]
MNTSINNLINLDDLLQSHCSIAEVERVLTDIFEGMSREEIIIHLAMWIHTQRMVQKHRKS